MTRRMTCCGLAMTIGWILAYDIWNITFVYLNFPNTVLFTAMVVLAPTLAAVFIKPGTWMQVPGLHACHLHDSYFQFQVSRGQLFQRPVHPAVAA